MRRNWKRKKETLDIKMGRGSLASFRIETLESCGGFGIWDLGIPGQRALVDLPSVQNSGKGQLK